jgi:hypothetical protein
LLEYIARAIYGQVIDPKRIDGDINSLTYEEKRAISERAASDAVKARRARSEESDGDHRSSISSWREIFGTYFPQYG